MSNKPLATLCIAFYNQEDFAEDTVKGALSQTYENLEIVFSDDHSTDNTFAVLTRLLENYSGPHKIILNRNQQNMGLVPHVNKMLFELSHGEYLFLNGGDDISFPGRIAWGIDYFLSDPRIMSVTGSCIEIDESGRQIGVRLADNDSLLSVEDYEFLSSNSFMTGGVGLSISRKVLDVFGKMNSDCPTEDSVLRFRSMLLGPTLRSKNIAIQYRLHGNNMSKHIFKLKTDKISKQYLADLSRVENYLTDEILEKLRRKVIYYSDCRNLEEKMQVMSRFTRWYYRWKMTRVKREYMSQL